MSRLNENTTGVPEGRRPTRKETRKLLRSEIRNSAVDSAHFDLVPPVECDEIEFIFGHSETPNAEPIQWKWIVREGKKSSAGAVSDGSNIIVFRQDGSLGSIPPFRVRNSERFRSGFSIVFGSGGGTAIVNFYRGDRADE